MLEALTGQILLCSYCTVKLPRLSIEKSEPFVNLAKNNHQGYSLTNLPTSNTNSGE